MLESWSVGSVGVFWSVKEFECWRVGVLESWSVGVLRVLRVLECWDCLFESLVHCGFGLCLLIFR